MFGNSIKEQLISAGARDKAPVCSFEDVCNVMTSLTRQEKSVMYKISTNCYIRLVNLLP